MSKRTYEDNCGFEKIARKRPIKFKGASRRDRDAQRNAKADYGDE